MPTHRTRGAASRRAIVATLAFAAIVPATAENVGAWRVPVSAPGDPACVAIPDARDIALNVDEEARVDAGEIVVRFLRRAERGAFVQAVGFLDANPAWLFEVATDSSLADGMADIIREVQVLETRPAGKVMRGVARPSLFLPHFDYKLAVSYLEDGTGQCWSQIDGDFRKNGGSQSYLWDSDRRQTLAVFTFEIELKGMLSVLPRGMVMRLTARTLPDYMRSLERLAQSLARDDAARAARVEPRWRSLRARLEGDELEGRLWPAGGHGALLSAGHGTASGDGGQ